MMTWGTGDDRCADYAAASPCEMCNAPQHVLEPILLDAARSFGADIRFDHEVVAVSQTSNQAVARVRKRFDGAELKFGAVTSSVAMAPVLWSATWRLRIRR